MKNCTDCAHANWIKTEKGRLHPSGDGKCTFMVSMPVLPGYYSEWTKKHPASGLEIYPGINRRRELKDHCPCYARKQP